MASNCQLGYDDDRFESIVNRNFHCLICFNVLKDPVMCGRNEHYFCRGCITQQLYTDSRTCPTCTDELSVETLSDVPRIVKEYLNELSIRCDYYDRGCREVVQLQNLEKHVAECGFKPFVCENLGCGETLNKRDRVYHECEQCEFRKLKYHSCEKISTMTADTKTEMTKISTRTANTSTKVENIDTEMERMETKIENIDTKIGILDTSFANIDTKVERLDTKMENIYTDMAKLHANVGTKFEAVNNEVRGIKTSLTEVKDGFDDLKEAVLGKTASKERNQKEIRRDVSATASRKREKQHIFVAGGYGVNSVEIFNYRQKLWSLLQPMPEKRDSSYSFVYNNHVIVAGGLCDHGAIDNMIRMNINPIPDQSTNWDDFAPKLPAKLEAHSCVVYKDSLFVTGGYISDETNVMSDCIYEVQLKPPYRVNMVSKMPESRIDHHTVLSNDSILIFGGRKAICYDNLSSVLCYNIKSKVCRQLPPLPFPVETVATVKWAENVVIIGAGNALNSVVIHNVKTGDSHMLPSMLHKRYGCMAVVIENMIVVMGGRDERGNALKSVESFSFDRYTWENLPDMKEGRCYATAVVI